MITQFWSKDQDVSQATLNALLMLRSVRRIIASLKRTHGLIVNDRDLVVAMQSIDWATQNPNILSRRNFCSIWVTEFPRHKKCGPRDILSRFCVAGNFESAMLHWGCNRIHGCLVVVSPCCSEKHARDPFEVS